jgi:hypothetical protein
MELILPDELEQYRKIAERAVNEPQNIGSP